MTETTFEGPTPSGRWARWKQVAIFVLAPSLILGLFTIAPKLYEIATTPNTILVYNVTSGPLLPTPSGVKQIYSIYIENRGSTPITDIVADFSEPGSKIESANLEKGNMDASGVATGDKYLLKVSQMFPTESISIALLIAANEKSSLLLVNMRSHETLGRRVQQISGLGDESVWSILGSALPYLLPAALALTGFQILFIRRGAFSSIIHDDRSDIVRFIAKGCQVTEISEIRMFDDTEITYRRLADALFLIGITNDEEIRSRCLRGLHALLLVKRISSDTIVIIRNHITNLGEPIDDKIFDNIRASSMEFENAQMRLKIYHVLAGITKLL